MTRLHSALRPPGAPGAGAVLTLPAPCSWSCGMLSEARWTQWGKIKSPNEFCSTWREGDSVSPSDVS